MNTSVKTIEIVSPVAGAEHHLYAVEDQRLQMIVKTPVLRAISRLSSLHQQDLTMTRVLTSSIHFR